MSKFRSDIVDQYKLEQDIKNCIAQGIPLSMDEIFDRKAYIERQQDSCFPVYGQKGPAGSRYNHISAWSHTVSPGLGLSSRYSSSGNAGSTRRSSAATVRVGGLNAQQKAIRKHIERSTRMYHKEPANRYLVLREDNIRRYGVMPFGDYVAVRLAMEEGTQFWRDPQAMSALAKQETPVCHGCHGHGQILDRYFRNVVFAEGEDVTKVDDFDDWGLFVMFRCGCCHDGFGYQDTSVYHNIEMQD